MVRAVGRGAGAARDIDAAHRRDGLALGLLALAVICAVGSWFKGAGPVGAGVDRAVRVSVGAPGVVLPMLLVVAAIVLMRSRGDGEHLTRRIVGIVALTLAVTGIFHVVHAASLPPGADSTGQRESAGGALGWLLGQPLFTGVTAAPAIILLVLLGLFGVLLLTGTALRDIPSAFVRGVDWVRGDRPMRRTSTTITASTAR